MSPYVGLTAKRDSLRRPGAVDPADPPGRAEQLEPPVAGVPGDRSGPHLVARVEGHRAVRGRAGEAAVAEVRHWKVEEGEIAYNNGRNHARVREIIGGFVVIARPVINFAYRSVLARECYESVSFLIPPAKLTDVRTSQK